MSNEITIPTLSSNYLEIHTTCKINKNIFNLFIKHPSCLKVYLQSIRKKLIKINSMY